MYVYRTMKEHLENTSSIVRDIDPAPATKRAMLLRDTLTRLPTEALTVPATAGALHFHQLYPKGLL